MTSDKKIDEILQVIAITGQTLSFGKVYKKVTGYSGNFSDALIRRDKDLVRQIMADEKLITLSSDLENCWLAPFGDKVSKDGGWMKEVERRAISEENEAAEKKLQIDLAKSNIEANRINKIIQKRNFRYLVAGSIMTAIAIAISILNVLGIFSK